MKGKSAIIGKWYDFKEKGMLTHELIDAIWTKEENPEFYRNKNHILHLMEKMNIIAKPRSYSDDGKEQVENYFLAPCMLQQATPAEIISPEPHHQRENTSVLCYAFKGKYLPSPIFHRLIAACLTHWSIAKRKSENLIFCGCCVLDIDPCHKLTLYLRDYVIFARVAKVSSKKKTPDLKLCIDVKDFIKENLLRIIGSLCHNLEFELHIQCPESEKDCVDSIFPVSKLQENEELCCSVHGNDHSVVSHDLLKFWFEDEESQERDEDIGTRKNLVVQGEIEVSQKGNLKAVINQTETVSIHKRLAELSKSVGIIRTLFGSGTGFRVGPNYIMTARHVVEPIMMKVPFLQQQQMQLPEQHQLNDANMHIDFSYEQNSVLSDPNLVFYFEPEIVYENAYLDTVILKLKPGTKVYPPPLTNFTDVTRLSLDKSHGYFIGHSGATIKKTDKYQIVTPTTSEICDAKKWSMDIVNEDGYDGIDNKHRVLFHCSFEKGASGAPGFWINPVDGQANVELMLLCGYPRWYYDKYEDKMIGISKYFFVEQGVSMKSVYDDVKARDELLCSTIFVSR